MNPAPGWGPRAPGTATPAGDLHIDRLVLHVAGLEEGTEVALARLVAAGLATGMLRSHGMPGLDNLHVELTAGAAERAKPDLLARRIVDEIGRVLGLGRASGGPDEGALP
jgi:hypothetical protein